jgi:hypothetical protein
MQIALPVPLSISLISQDLRKSSDEKKKNRWVSYCNNELNKSVQSNDYSLTSTIIISLSDMRYIGALSYLIESDLVEETMKSAAISKNYKTIIDALSKEPTDKVIKTAIKAMEIRPISETIKLQAEMIHIHIIRHLLLTTFGITVFFPVFFTHQ